MKRSLQLRMLITISVIATSIILFAFTTTPGGEGFEVYRNNKLLLQQFGNDMKQVKTLQLEKLQSADILTIKYYHCGKTGKNRQIIVRNEHNTQLKNWQFTNLSSRDEGMSFHPSDIIKNGKNVSKVNVFYTSEEIPREKLLVMLQFRS
ncbi:MAG: hypothetical protein ABW007_18105 [Chitinophagaceae bacterium]